MVLSPNSHRNEESSPPFSVIYILFTDSNAPSLNSHRKMKTAPLLKKIPHLYEKNRGFGNPFWRLWTMFLQFVYRNRPCKRNLRHGTPARPQNEVLLLALKNIPHLIGQKMGKIQVLLRIVYFLFTKIDSENKKCAFQRKKEVWVFFPDLVIFVYLSSPKGRRKVSAISCTPSRNP